MAGYDAHFRYLPHDEPLVRAMFAAARRRRSEFRIRRWRSEINTTEQTAWCAMDGNSFALDIFAERLRRDLPTICEATDTKRRPSQRRRVAGGFIEILARHRYLYYDNPDVVWPPLLTARTDPWRIIVHHLFTPDEQGRLQERLHVTMNLMASWHLGEVAPEVLVEELHTAAELMMEAISNRRAKRLSFRELVEQTFPLDGIAEEPEWRQRRREEEIEVLLALKDLRKRVRHRGESGAQEWLEEHFWDVGLLLERLVERVPKRDRHGDD